MMKTSQPSLLNEESVPIFMLGTTQDIKQIIDKVQAKRSTHLGMKRASYGAGGDVNHTKSTLSRIGGD